VVLGDDVGLLVAVGLGDDEAVGDGDVVPLGDGDVVPLGDGDVVPLGDADGDGVSVLGDGSARGEGSVPRSVLPSGSSTALDASAVAGSPAAVCATAARPCGTVHVSPGRTGA